MKLSGKEKEKILSNSYYAHDGSFNTLRFGYYKEMQNSPNDPASLNYAGTAAQRIAHLIRSGTSSSKIDYWIQYEEAKRTQTVFINPTGKSAENLESRGVTSSVMENVIDFTPVVYFDPKTSPEYIAEQQRILNKKEAERLAEVARLELKAKNDQIALNLWNKLESERIAKEQAEIKRLAQVKEAQRLAAIEAERLRIELLDKQEKERIQKEQTEIKRLAEVKESQRVDKSIPLIASVLPITALGILLLYSRGGKS